MSKSNESALSEINQIMRGRYVIKRLVWSEWKLAWGVDGCGVKHYLCDFCEIVFGSHDKPEEIKHEGYGRWQ